MSVQTEAVEAIEAQQKAVKYHSRQWMAGEQLKEICRREPKSAELLLADLQREAMSITAAEKRIEAFARKNGNCASPIEAEEVLRQFYGLPPAEEAPPSPAPPEDRGILDLSDFL